MTIEILYQNHDIIVINKPSGLSVTKDRTGSPQLLDLLKRKIDTETISRLRLVHRLDKDTSGVLLLAKNKQAQTTFSRMFEDRLTQKTYLAIVRGPITQNSGTIDLPLMPDRKQPNRMCIAKTKGKSAVTQWKLLADFGTAKLLAVHPLTGRTHQIRVHLSAVGLPLAIDPFYSSSKPLYLSEFKTNYHLAKGQEEIPLIERLTLHAYQLVIPAQPVLSEACTEQGRSVEGAQIQSHCFVAPLEKKFAATIKMLTKHNPKGNDAWLNSDLLNAILSAGQID